MFYATEEILSQFLQSAPAVDPVQTEEQRTSFLINLDKLLNDCLANDTSDVDNNVDFISNEPQVQGNLTKESQASENIFCPRCTGSSKTYKGLRGLRIHYSFSHKSFSDDFEDEEFLAAILVQSASTRPSQDLNDIICQRCTSKPKICKGLRGLKIHYAHAHKDYLSDLSHQPQPSSENIEDFLNHLSRCKQSLRVLKRVPKGARFAAARKLEELIVCCVDNNDLCSWIDLLNFSYVALRVPKRSSKKNKLTSIVKKNIADFDVSTIQFSTKECKASLSKRVESKVSEGDIRGAVKLLSSSNDFAPHNSEVLENLRLKHPAPSRPLHLPPVPDSTDVHLIVSEGDMIEGIKDFPNGSGSGMDGLRPQVLKDLLNNEVGASGLVGALTKLSNLMLEGKVLESICPILYGASLCALDKKDGGVRPIAIGNTFRRLTAKLACRSIRGPIGDYLRPHQLGFATRGGCEAIIHGSRAFLVKNHGSSKVGLKIDFRNAFNSIERDEMLHSIKQKTPELYAFLYQCYSSDSYLFFGKDIILSQVGAQQGDPLGPMAFSLTIQPIVETLLSELNVWYLDDGTLGGDVDSVLSDFKNIVDGCRKFGLEINSSKCELFFLSQFDQQAYDKFAAISPGIRVIEDFSLLGAPITDGSFDPILIEKLEELKLLLERVKDLSNHVAYFLMKNCLFIPKLTYLLRTCPVWKSSRLVFEFDNLLLRSLQEITNIPLSDRHLTLASLPVRFGGLGIRKVSDIALPTFLSSINCVFNLVCATLPSIQIDLIDIPYYEDAMIEWIHLCPDTDFPSKPSIQHEWDNINIKRIVDNVHFETEIDVARYKASVVKESSAWLTVLPSKMIGTHLDNNVFRISVALRLGGKICSPHTCPCGDKVDETGIHGLSCGRSIGRLPRHSCFNSLIKRALATARIPSTLEPVGLTRDDGKRPDGMSLITWKNGQSLVWDATCRDTLAPSYRHLSSRSAGLVAEAAATHKKNHYKKLIASNFFFVPFAIETLGPWCADAKDLISSIGKLICAITGDPKSTNYLVQRLSIELQRYNAACVMGTLPISCAMDEIFFVL